MNLLEAVSRVIAEAFVAGIWQGVALVLVVGGLLRMIPRLSAGTRFGIWGLAFLAAVVVPFVRFSGAGREGGSGVRVALGWGFAIAGCWGLLTSVRVGRLIGQGLQLRKIWMEAVPVEVGDGLAELLGEMARKPVLCVSGAVDAPSVIGFWSPKLLIPEWQIGSLSEGEMRQIVLHECEHLRRGDDWMNLAQKLGLALFPMNPALLWADRRMGLEREMACDAGVVRRTGAAFDYASCLTRLAEQRLGRRSLGLALSAWGRESELGQRVHRLLRPVAGMGRASARVSVGVLAVVVAGGSLELARMPGLVSFGDVPAVQVSAAAPMSSVEREPVGRAGRMMPVVYREPVAGRKVRALRGKRVRSRLVRSRQGAGSSRQAGLEQQVLFDGRTGLMLTTAEVSPVEPVRVRRVEAVVREDVLSYAAVPFGNGWLILQL